jgi:hypothetical protein
MLSNLSRRFRFPPALRCRDVHGVPWRAAKSCTLLGVFLGSYLQCSATTWSFAITAYALHLIPTAAPKIALDGFAFTVDALHKSNRATLAARETGMCRTPFTLQGSR